MLILETLIYKFISLPHNKFIFKTLLNVFNNSLKLIFFMKKIYLAILLFLPISIMAQTEEVKSATEDSLQVKTVEVTEKVYPAKDSIPTAIDTAIKTPEKVVEEVEETSKVTEAPELEAKPIIEETSTVIKIINPECISGNCKDGLGTMKYQSGTYKGRWKNKLRHGQGKFTWNTGDTYYGSWSNDQRHGEGTYTWSDSSKYVGHYSAGVRSGYGIYYYTNGNIYEGTWQNNLKHGIANFYFTKNVNIGGKYVNNEYVSGTGVDKDSYAYRP